MVIIRGSSRFRLFLHTGLVALAYYAGAKVGLAYAIVGGAVSLVWPSSGIALVALLALGFEVAPGIVIGSFLANVSVGVPLPVAALIGAGALLGGGLVPVAEYDAAFLKWWLGDMMGVLVVAPPLFSFLTYSN